jgi:hypothetical protein
MPLDHRDRHSQLAGHLNPSELVKRLPGGLTLLRQAVAKAAQLQAAPVRAVDDAADLPHRRLSRLCRSDEAHSEQEPTVFGGDPDLFAARLATPATSTRNWQSSNSRAGRWGIAIAAVSDFSACALGGLITLLIENVTRRTHHIQFIAEKRCVGSESGVSRGAISRQRLWCRF